MIRSLHHERTLRRAGGGIGQFTGNEPDPQQAGDAVARELKGSLTDQPGIRLAQATGRRVYFGGGLTPQRFVRGPAETNDDDAIRAGSRAIIARRTAGRMRG